jgi:multidrug efflux pump subunit AcrA (membrane-fusion protein)
MPLRLFIVIAVLLLSACAGQQPVDTTPATGATSTPIPTIEAIARPTYTVQRGNVEQVFEFSGRWQPRDQAQLSFEIAGTLRRVEVRAGDTIMTGQLLADLQITEQENQLASAQLELETALAGLQSGSEGTVMTVADAEVALANARLRLESVRAQSPWTAVANARIAVDSAEQALAAAQRAYDDAISRPDQPASVIDGAYNALVNAQNNLRSAQISYDAAAQNFNNHAFSVAEAENGVLQAELNLQNARAGVGADPQRVQAVAAAQLRIDQINASIRQSSLYSPIDGTVLEVSIRPGDQAQAFQVVITVGRPEPLEIIASLAAGDAQRLSVGQIGICQIINRPESAVQCVVRRLPASARDADQTTRVAASLQLVDPSIQTGQVIEVRMPLQTRADVLWLPPVAIRTFQNRTFVVLQTPDGPRAVNVELGLRTDERVEIISGVNEGDVVEAP